MSIGAWQAVGQRGPPRRRPSIEGSAAEGFGGAVAQKESCKGSYENGPCVDVWYTSCNMSICVYINRETHTQVHNESGSTSRAHGLEYEGMGILDLEPAGKQQLLNSVELKSAISSRRRPCLRRTVVCGTALYKWLFGLPKSS